jgi:hypothetical protein
VASAVFSHPRTEQSIRGPLTDFARRLRLASLSARQGVPDGGDFLTRRGASRTSLLAQDGGQSPICPVSRERPFISKRTLPFVLPDVCNGS